MQMSDITINIFRTLTGKFKLFMPAFNLFVLFNWKNCFYYEKRKPLES